MSHLPSSFPSDLGIATRVGLTQGVGFGPGPGSFAEAEIRYRRHRMIEDANRARRSRRARRRDQVPVQAPAGARSTGRREATDREVMSRWSTWLPSVLLVHRSSPAKPSSGACGS